MSIELGKFGTSFIVNKKYWHGKGEQPIIDLMINFEERACVVSAIYEDSVVLKLVSNNQDDFIKITI